MKKIPYYLVILIVVLVSCKTKTNTEILKHPQLAVVQDYGKLFSKIQKDSLSKKVINYEIISTNEICIYTLDSLPKDMSIHFYATTLANNLGIGKKDKDNGLLILISKHDRQIAISTGYGTEKTITDYDCKRIIDNTIVPHFKNQNYYKGVSITLDSLIVMWD